MDSSAARETKVSIDRSKNLGPTIAVGAMAVVGLALFGYGWTHGWGFLGLFWVGVLAVGGLAGSVGRLMGGGFATAPCPACGAKLSFAHIKAERTTRCAGCGAWSTGTATMRLVADDHVARAPTYPAPLPTEGVNWPMGDHGAVPCPTCGAASTRWVKITGADAMGTVFAAVSPVSVQRIRSLEVPACAAHDDGVGLLVVGSTVELLFRSRAFQRTFLERNPPPADWSPATAAGQGD